MSFGQYGFVIISGVPSKRSENTYNILRHGPSPKVHNTAAVSRKYFYHNTEPCLEIHEFTYDPLVTNLAQHHD